MLTMFISGLVIFGIALPITGYSFNEIFKYIGEIPNLWLWIVKYGFLNLLQILSGILFFYLAISVGQLFKKNRIMMAVLFGFLIWSVLAILSIFLPSFFNPYGLFDSYVYSNSDTDFEMMLDAFLIIRIVFELVKIFGFYFTIHTIVKNKLNLQ